MMHFDIWDAICILGLGCLSWEILRGARAGGIDRSRLLLLLTGLVLFIALVLDDCLETVSSWMSLGALLLTAAAVLQGISGREAPSDQAP